MIPRRSLLWWEPPRDSLPIEFCADTSLHGLKYISQPKRSFVERFFWIAAFLIALTVAVILSRIVFEKYQTSPIVTVFDDHPVNVHQIPFPAITLCNVNNIQLDKAAEIIRDGYSGTQEALAKVSLLNHICSTSAVSFSQKFGYDANGSTIPAELLKKIEEMNIDEEQILNITITDFLQRNAQPCRQMILLCLWENSIEKCPDIFQRIETDFGKCCTFNMIPGSLQLIYQNYSRDRESDILDWANSNLNVDEIILQKEDAMDLIMSLKARGTTGKSRKFPRRANRAGQSNGLSVLINPGVKEYFCSTAVFVGVEFSVHQPTAKPDVAELGKGIHPGSEVFVSITPDVVQADPALKKYNLSNCVDECLANLTFESCGCVQYHMPRDPKVQDICAIRHFECAKRALRSFTTHELQGPCSICLPTCNEVQYLTEVHNGPIRDDVEVWLNKEGKRENWSDWKVSIVHFYFDQESVYPKIRKELYGFTDLLASVGGLLGLCLGFSIMSFLEIVYFLTIRCFFAILRKKHVEDAIQVEEPEPLQVQHQQQVQNLRHHHQQQETNTVSKDDQKLVHKQGPIMYPEFFYRELMPVGARGRPTLEEAYKVKRN